MEEGKPSGPRRYADKRKQDSAGNREADQDPDLLLVDLMHPLAELGVLVGQRLGGMPSSPGAVLRFLDASSRSAIQSRKTGSPRCRWTAAGPALNTAKINRPFQPGST